jgi:hypothetical protein
VVAVVAVVAVVVAVEIPVRLRKTIITKKTTTKRERVGPTANKREGGAEDSRTRRRKTRTNMVQE